MDREVLFEKFINECEKNNQICGQGNPNAHIMIIGKEPYMDLKTNPISLQEELQRQYERCKRGDFGNAKRGKNPTWCNYQSLIEKVYKPKVEFNSGLFDFEKYAFTTELSSIPRKNSKYSEAEPFIQDRLRCFEKSKFIQDFPVIILACGGYIKNDDKVREIDNTFHVEFCKEYGSKESKNRFWTHIDKKDPRKLVIHTRQFSNGISKDLVKQMAEVIKTHLNHIRELGLI